VGGEKVEENGKQEKETGSVSQLIDDVHQLIRGYKLHPAVELLLFIVEHEFDPVVTPEVRRTTLVLLFDHLAFPLDPHAGLVQPELPPIQRSAIPRGCAVWYVEFQTGPIEPEGLTHCPNVCLLECQKDAKASQDNVFGVFWSNERYLERGQLNRRSATNRFGCRWFRTNFMVERLGVGQNGSFARLNLHSLDSHSDIDDVSLPPLGHRHGDDVMLPSEVVTYHCSDAIGWNWNIRI
jgi:hypothetical protein